MDQNSAAGGNTGNESDEEDQFVSLDVDPDGLDMSPATIKYGLRLTVNFPWFNACLVLRCNQK